MAARRSKAPGPQAHPSNYPHLSAMGVRRVPTKALITYTDHSGTITGTAIILQAAWLAGVYFKILVLQELGFWPAIVVPMIAIASARSFAAAVRSAVLTAITIPAIVVFFMMGAMCIGAAIAYSRSEPIEWFTANWRSILQKNLGVFPETWMHLLASTGPLMGLGFVAKLVTDLFRR